MALNKIFDHLRELINQVHTAHGSPNWSLSCVNGRLTLEFPLNLQPSSSQRHPSKIAWNNFPPPLAKSKRKSPSTLARDRRRRQAFLEKKRASRDVTPTPAAESSRPGAGTASPSEEPDSIPVADDSATLAPDTQTSPSGVETPPVRLPTAPREIRTIRSMFCATDMLNDDHLAIAAGTHRPQPSSLRKLAWMAGKKYAKSLAEMYDDKIARLQKSLASEKEMRQVYLHSCVQLQEQRDAQHERSMTKLIKTRICWNPNCPKELKRCTRCKDSQLPALYCTKSCQKEHWKDHKADCL